MNVIIDPQLAEQILRSSISQVQSEGWVPSGAFSDQIQAVMLGTHKTYRYILLNGLLAKATNENCNPVVLQAGSELDGAFDARSLCHGVVVPIERELLGDRLGASNEPFLNKPARFPELATTNAVRRGNDTRMLHAAVEVLSNIQNSEEAKESLNDCVYWVFQRESRNLMDYLSGNQGDFQQSSLIAFANELISESIEGETCALLAGATFDILALALDRSLDVKTHKVNQAGSSSNEVSDIDVYENDNLIFTAEVKDKVFTAQDVEHAISKVAISGHNALIFMKGPRGALEGTNESDLQSQWADNGFNIYFVNLIDYFTSVLTLTNRISNSDFVGWLNSHADSAKVKDETFTHLTTCAQKLGR